MYFASSTPPAVGSDAFNGVKSGARAIVPYGTTAYGAEGTLWNGLIVTYGDATISLPTIDFYTDKYIDGQLQQQIEIPISIKTNPGLVNFEMTIEYDPAVLTPVAVNSGDVWNSDIIRNLQYESNKIFITAAASANKNGDGI